MHVSIYKIFFKIIPQLHRVQLNFNNEHDSLTIFSPEDLRSRDLRTPHVPVCVCLSVSVSVTKDLKSCHATSHLFGNFMQEMALVFRTITAPIDR